MEGLNEYLLRTRRWQAAVLLTVPLFGVYEAGLLLLTAGDRRNAADVILRHVLGVRGSWGPVVLNTLVLLLFLAASRARASGGVFRFLPLVWLESALYAVLVVPVTRLVVGLGLAAGGGGPATDAVMSIGAGLYEELLFRLVGVAGGFALLVNVAGVDRIWAAVTALVGSALLFSAYHHTGPGGEPWEAGRFAFRFVAGVLLGVLFLLRGFAVTCWTHALYDLMVVLQDA